MIAEARKLLRSGESEGFCDRSEPQCLWMEARLWGGAGPGPLEHGVGRPIIRGHTVDGGLLVPVCRVPVGVDVMMKLTTKVQWRSICVMEESLTLLVMRVRLLILILVVTVMGIMIWIRELFLRKLSREEGVRRSRTPRLLLLHPLLPVRVVTLLLLPLEVGLPFFEAGDGGGLHGPEVDLLPLDVGDEQLSLDPRLGLDVVLHDDVSVVLMESG